MSALWPPGFAGAAPVLYVHDGDTFAVPYVDLGFGVRVAPLGDVDHWLVRLRGGNARELAAPGGADAGANLASLLPHGTKVWLRSERPDAFGGRFVASVATPDGSDLVDLLIAAQWLAPYDGRQTPKPVPPWPRTVR